MTELLKLPEVEPVRVYTNNIKEVEAVFGIEAASNSIDF
ncbi:DNA-directed RNA polymerase subunit A'' [uncultured archaeon]|nr:DNA-directed RNA polymerase subunit A'' [uncultured archaeon]